MKHEVFRYEFSGKVPIKDAEEALGVATMAAESIFGRVRVLMDASVRLDRVSRTCRVDADTEVGLVIAQVFTGLLVRGFGERAFRVERGEAGFGSCDCGQAAGNDSSDEPSVVQAIMQAMGVKR